MMMEDMSSQNIWDNLFRKHTYLESIAIHYSNSLHLIKIITLLHCIRYSKQAINLLNICLFIVLLSNWSVFLSSLTLYERTTKWFSNNLKVTNHACFKQSFTMFEEAYSDHEWLQINRKMLIELSMHYKT